MTKATVTNPGSVTIVTVAGQAIKVKPAGFLEWESILDALDGEINTRTDIARRAFNIVAGALQRTRPDVTAEWIEENISAGEIFPLIDAAGLILEASGLKRKATDTGEALPANRSRDPS